LELSFSDVAGFCVEADEEFVCKGDADDFGRFSLVGEAVAEGDEVGFVAAGDAGDDEEDVAQLGASSSDTALPLALSAILSEGRETGEFGGGLVGDGADLGHLGGEARDGAVGDAFDGTEGVIEFSPERVLLDEGGDLGCELIDLPVEDGEKFLEAGLDARLGDEPLLIELRGAPGG